MNDPTMYQPQSQQWSDEELQQMGYDEAALRALLAKQYGLGGDLATMQGPQGYNVSGTYKAASPLEHITSALVRAMGAYKMGKADTGTRDSLTRESVVAGRAARRDLETQDMVRQLHQAMFGPKRTAQPGVASAPSFGSPLDPMYGAGF